MRKKLLVFFTIAALLTTTSASAFLEDLCLPRRNDQGVLTWCIRPECHLGPNYACPAQLADFATIEPGRSMIHADSTYFLAQALGYRADVAYWIVAYNETADYGQYKPIDQCGVQAAKTNSGRHYIGAAFNGFLRTNTSTDGPLDHYVVNYSPNGEGTDVHGAGGVQSLYPFYYPRPGYPVRIDDTYQKTLANLRQWAMLKTSEPGLLCTVGLTDGEGCFEGRITGIVPLIKTQPSQGVPIDVAAGRKVLNYNSSTDIDYYEKLKSYLDDPLKTTGTLWMDRTPAPVPVQLARIGLYLHVLQDTSSHSTYCGDDAPSPPGGADPGTYMYVDGKQVKVVFGLSCSASPHLAGHVQETGTGAHPLPLRDYVALNNTLDDLIVFGNSVALAHGWIANPELLPPDTIGGRNAQGQSAADLEATLIGTIVKGTAYSRAEVYKSGVVTLPLQQTSTLDRLHAMNEALGRYSASVRAKSASPTRFVPFQPMPGNSFDAKDRSACWK
jgi:hypothetical protein